VNESEGTQNNLVKEKGQAVVVTGSSEGWEKEGRRQTMVTHPVHHLTPLLATIQACTLLARTGLITYLSIPVAAGQTHQLAPLPPLVLLYFTACQTAPSYFLLAAGL